MTRRSQAHEKLRMRKSKGKNIYGKKKKLPAIPSTLFYDGQLLYYPNLATEKSNLPFSESQSSSELLALTAFL